MKISKTAPTRSVRFGLNYVPGKRWYYCWNDWNRDEIAADLDAIAALGADHIRVQLVWPWFQPNPTQVSVCHLERLRELMTLARERDLDVLVCALTGWLSGYDFLPPNIQRNDVFLSADVMEQSILYFQTLLDTVGDDSNFLGFDLGNEINVLSIQLPLEQGDAWGKKLTDWLRPRMNGRWIVNGIDNLPLYRGSMFSTRHLAHAYDAFCLHAWPEFTGCLKRGPLDGTPSVHLAAFLTHLCRHFLAREGLEKPVWVQEFGCSEAWGDAGEREAYLRGSVTHAVAAGATWFTWWCSHDIDRRYRFNELEYSLGLLTVDNQPKALAKTFRDLVLEFSGRPFITPPPLSAVLPGIMPAFEPSITRALPGSEWVEQNWATTTGELFERYLQNLPSSVRVCSVLNWANSKSGRSSVKLETAPH